MTAFRNRNYHPLVDRSIQDGKFLNLDEFLLDNEMVAACNRLDARLIDAIWEAFDDILQRAVYMTVDNDKIEETKKLSTRATECIGNPSVLKKVCEKDQIGNTMFDKLMKYLAPEYDNFYKDHPVFAGHLSHILSLSLVSLDNSEQLSDEQRMRLLKAIVRQTDQVGFQDMLVQTMNDGRFDKFLQDACRYIAEELYSFSMDVEHKSEHLCGGVWALLTVFSDRERDDKLKIVANDVEFMANLVAAVFNQPEANGHTYLAFCHGIRLIGSLVELVEKQQRKFEDWSGEVIEQKDYLCVKNGVSRMLKQFSKQWYQKMGVETIDWGGFSKQWGENKAEEMRRSREWLMIQAFPVLWYYPIDHMVPLFFKDEGNFFGDFSRAFFRRVKNMSRARFVDFIDKHQIIEKILQAAPKFALTKDVQEEDAEHPKQSLNLWIMSLARAIAGKREQVPDGRWEPCRPHSLLRDHDLEVKFSEFLWKHALPDRECRNHDWTNKPKT